MAVVNIDSMAPDAVPLIQQAGGKTARHPFKAWHAMAGCKLKDWKADVMSWWSSCRPAEHPACILVYEGLVSIAILLSIGAFQEGFDLLLLVFHKVIVSTPPLTSPLQCIVEHEQPQQSLLTIFRGCSPVATQIATSILSKENVKLMKSSSQGLYILTAFLCNLCYATDRPPEPET